MKRTPSHISLLPSPSVDLLRCHRVGLGVGGTLPLATIVSCFSVSPVEIGGDTAPLATIVSCPGGGLVGGVLCPSCYHCQLFLRSVVIPVPSGEDWWGPRPSCYHRQLFLQWIGGGTAPLATIVSSGGGLVGVLPLLLPSSGGGPAPLATIVSFFFVCDIKGGRQ